MRLLLLAFLLPCFCASAQQQYRADVSDTVRILVDRWGVPHIYAPSQTDLFYAQGFNAARDRLFQFELWRRQATGTVAEILGPRELKRDIGTRLFQFRGDITAEMAHYHPQGVEIIQAFVAGVNAYVDWINAHPDQLPEEFKMLDLRPQHWTPEVVISRHQGLLGNIGSELKIGRLMDLLGEKKVRELMWFHPNEPRLAMDEQIDPSHLHKDILELYHAYRRPVSFVTSDLGMSEGPEPAKDEDQWNLDNPMDLGSNNWVVSGEHTQSGYPMLANDPHRAVAVPSLRYMSHLVGPGWNVIGAGEPEIPGISIGHNEYGAWGLTVFITDAEDLYVYRLNEQHPDQYWHNEQWEDMVVLTDTIPIKGGPPEIVKLRYTRHGPLVYRDEEAGIGYAVRCGWLEVGGSPYLASLRMNQSFDFESFREACNYSHIPGENMIWADRAGNIGWQAVGIAPIRNHFSGLVPIPGDGSHEWSGYLEIVRKPNSYNPSSGVIITANENVTPRDYAYPEALGFEWTDPVRGDRIAEVLAQGRKATLQDMAALQNDHLSIPARNLVPLLPNAPDTGRLREAVAILRAWDFRMAPYAVAAAIYNEWERALHQGLARLKVPAKARHLVRSFQHKKVVDWLTVPDGTFGPEPVAGRDRFLLQCLEEAMEVLSKRLGNDISEWQYGQEKYKHVLITHALGKVAEASVADRLNVGPIPRGGSGSTVGNTGGNLNQSSGATFKIIIDTEDWDRTLAINAPGQSGDPRSKHYRDLFELWGRDGYFPLFFSKGKVESVVDEVILLVPK